MYYFITHARTVPRQPQTPRSGGPQPTWVPHFLLYYYYFKSWYCWSVLVCFAIFKTKLKRIVNLKLHKILKIRSLYLYVSAAALQFHLWCNRISSVARGGGGGGSSPPIGLWSMHNRMFFVLLRPIFCGKWKIAPPIRKEPPLIRLNLRNWKKNRPEFWRRPFFFLEITQFWAEKTFEFWISAEKSLWILAKTFFFFFWRSRKKLSISDLSETFHLKFRTNRLKLIQGQWKFESRSFAHFSLFQNSPPPLFQILATRLNRITIAWF